MSPSLSTPTNNCACTSPMRRHNSKRRQGFPTRAYHPSSPIRIGRRPERLPTAIRTAAKSCSRRSSSGPTNPPKVTPRASIGVSPGCSAAPAGDAHVNRDENDRGENADEKGGEFEFALIGRGYQPVGDPRSDERPDRAEQDRHDDADVLSAGQNQPGQRTDNEPDKDRTDNCSDHSDRLPIAADCTHGLDSGRPPGLRPPVAVLCAGLLWLTS